MSSRLTGAALKLAQASTTLICNYPFFATLLLQLTRVEDPTAPTMWTDGKRLGYNAAFVESLTPAELVGVLAHETVHVAGLHPWRRQARKPYPWNLACDAVVNQIVTECGLTLPKGCIPPVPNKSPEELYVDPPDGDGGGGTDPGGCGEVRDATNPDGSRLSDAQRAEQMEEARVRVRQAANAAKAAGKLPAGLKRFVDDALEPRIPWREILARFLDGQAKNDYCWTRPNRRYADYGIVLPSLWSPSYGKVVMGCDTSGSIDQQQLKEICSEVLGCLNLYEEQGQDPTLTVAWFDHAVYPQVVSDPADLNPQGGGGTSFSVVMDWLRESGEQPKALIMVTDGYCGDFGTAPECAVLWVLTNRLHGFNPPFGEVACVLND